MTKGDKVQAFAFRLSVEFPDWTRGQALAAARRIIDTSEQLDFQLSVERDLAALPLTQRETT